MFRRLFIRLAGTAPHSGDTAVPCHAARRRGKVTAWRGHYGAVEDAATRRSYFVHRRALVTEPSEGSVALRLRTAVEFDFVPLEDGTVAGQRVLVDRVTLAGGAPILCNAGPSATPSKKRGPRPRSACDAAEPLLAPEGHVLGWRLCRTSPSLAAVAPHLSTAKAARLPSSGPARLPLELAFPLGRFDAAAPWATVGRASAGAAVPPFPDEEECDAALALVLPSPVARASAATAGSCQGVERAPHATLV